MELKIDKTYDFLETDVFKAVLLSEKKKIGIAHFVTPPAKSAYCLK